MSSKIQQTQKKSYKEILSSTVSFHVPTFQRAYNWKPKQIASLWNSVVDNDKQYYIGNIVVVQHSTENIQAGFLVIDGQQRLTTLSLFLIAIKNYISRDKLKDKKKQHLQKHKEMIEEIKSSLIYSTAFSDENKIKLIFSKNNLSEIYKKLVYDDPENNSVLDEAQMRFVKNLHYINQLLRDYLKESGKSVRMAIQELVSKILELEFIIIECRNESDVYQIFEGLNSTGLELSVVDLVKNTVFKRIKEADTSALENAERIWEEMENNFELNKLSLFSKFLRHQWISKYGYINTAQLYDAIKIKLDKMLNSSEIIEFVQNMRDDAELYIALRSGDLEYFKNNFLAIESVLGIKKYLSSFCLLDSDQIFEILLAYCKKYKNNSEYTAKQFSNDLKNLWNLGLMIKIVSSVNPSKYEKKFADRCKALNDYNGKKYNTESAKFYADLWELVKDRKDEFVNNFNDILVYKKGNDLNNELLRFIFLTIYQKNNKGVTYEIKTVEHILSQSKYEFEDFLHHVGNLTILSVDMNRAASDKDFSLKYEEYYSRDIFDHNKTLNKYLFDTDPIGATNLRAKDLAKEAFETFSFV